MSNILRRDSGQGGGTEILAVQKDDLSLLGEAAIHPLGF